MALTPIPKGKILTESITKHMDKRFLSSIDLIGAGEVKLTIDRVEHLDSLKYANGTTDKNVNLLYFQGSEKPLSLNVTNINAIVTILGTNKVGEWSGKKVTLTVKKVDAFGEIKDAVRIIG